MLNYKTSLSEKIKELESLGYRDQYKMENGSLLNLSNRKRYKPKEVALVDKYRFEGESNPDDMAILYVLEGKDGTKGVLVNAYGTYGDEDIDSFMNEAPGKRQ